MADRMYNPDIKQRYLDTIKNADESKNVRSVFNNAAAFENTFNKDLCFFNFNNFITLFEKNGYVLGSRFNCNKSIVKNYIEWCVANRLCSPNGIIEIERMKSSDVSGYYMTNAKYFKSIDDLLDCIEQIYNTYKELGHNDLDITTYEPPEAFYGLYWYGLPDKEIYEFQFSQFDINQNVIITKDKHIPVCERFAEICKRVSMQEYTTGVDGKRRYFAGSSYLFKSTTKTQADKPINENYHVTKNKLWRTIMEEIPITHPYYGKVISTAAIERCGLFYRLYEMEKEGMEINTDVLVNEISWKPEIITPSKMNYCSNRLKDYRVWKEYCGL